MVKLGYTLSSEEFPPLELIAQAKRAEEIGSSYALISDHFHPWLDRQGQSPFVWSTIGGIAAATQRIEIGTGVICPIIRTHPVVIAHAAAIVASMLPGRFFLGVGTGEYLNEYVTGEHWPVLSTRQEMLREAVEIIRKLWQGEDVSYRGAFYTVENARMYTLPDAPPPIDVAASGKKSVEQAGDIGDGLISTSPNADVVKAFNKDGPVYEQMTVC